MEVKLTQGEAQAVRAALSALVVRSRTGELAIQHAADRFVSTRRIFKKVDGQALDAAGLAEYGG